MLSAVEIKSVDAHAGPERGLLYIVEMTFSVPRVVVVGVEANLLDAASQMLCARSTLIYLKSAEGRSTGSVAPIVGTQGGNALACLLLPLRDEALRIIEGRTDREHVNLNLRVRAQGHSIPAPPPNQPQSPPSTIGMPLFSQDFNTGPSPIAQSTWAGLLRKMGWSELALFEVPTLPLRDDPNLKTAIERLREAEGRLRSGDYRGVIAKCRDAFESAAKYEAAGDVAKGFDLLLKRAFKADDSKPPLLDGIVRALRDHANTLGRHEQYPVVPASRSEAEFAYASTVALFSMLSRRLAGQES